MHRGAACTASQAADQAAQGRLPSQPGLAWRAPTMAAAATTGSCVRCGMAAWPPRPAMTQSNCTAPAMMVPARERTDPEGSVGLQGAAGARVEARAVGRSALRARWQPAAGLPCTAPTLHSSSRPAGG